MHEGKSRAHPFHLPVCHALLLFLQAKALLKSKGVPFEEIDRDGLSATEVADLVRRSKGSETIPQIFIGDEHVGGCDDIHALDRKGQLDAKLKA